VDVLKHLRKRDGAATAEPNRLELGAAETEELASAFAAPRWLRDLGRTSWLLVGFFALTAGAIWLLGTTSTIVGPVVAGTIVATVAMPIVGVLGRHMPRAAASGIVLLGLAAIAALVVVLVIGGITSQRSSISEHATAAADKAEGWLNDFGVDRSGSSSAKSSLEQDVPKIVSTLVKV
jgi:predicted PurR-regulated permease PerM